jgi:membrane protein implicated in regulation of membrane protease activity
VTLEQLRLRAWRHSSRLGKRADKVVAAISRVRLAAHVAWLALSGDTTFFKHWEARHVQGVERFQREQRDARELGRYREALAGETAGVRDAVTQLGALRVRVKQQAWEINNMREIATLRNKQMEALHMVWCNGGCAGGVGDRENLTREKVLEAVSYTNRLVSWWNNRAYKDAGHRDDEGYKRARVDEKVSQIKDE